MQMKKQIAVCVYECVGVYMYALLGNKKDVVYTAISQPQMPCYIYHPTLTNMETVMEG